MLAAYVLLCFAPGMRPVRLQTEYLHEPLALQTLAPRFSWGLDDPRPGARQTAYEIVVERDGAEVWRTGKVASDAQSWIRYGGAPLQGGDTCVWRVRAWDHAGEPGPWAESRFETGVHGDWGADWITTPAPVPEARPPHNGYHSEMERSAEHEKWVLLDLGGGRPVDGVRLWPARPFDWREDAPGFLFPLRFRIEAGLDEGGLSTVYDATAADFPNPRDEPAVLRFPPVRARFVRLVATRLAGRGDGLFGIALAEMEVLEGGATVSTGAKVRAADSVEGGAWSMSRLTDGDTRSHPAEGYEALPATTLRRVVGLKAPVRRARLYATALGAYHATINGSDAGPNVLAPEWTDYGSRVMYQAFDVTGLLRQGENRIEVLLGDGWYAGRIGMAQALDPRKIPRGVYGRRAWFLGRLDIETEDGARIVVPTGPGWEAATDGPVRYSDILDGERTESGREPSDWAPAAATGRPEGREAPAVVAQPNEPVQVVERLRPAKAGSLPDGSILLDFGQNLAGRMSARLSGAPGAEVVLQFAEVLDDQGGVYTDNLRGAAQRDTVVLDGDGQADYRTRFTYHGFRYVQVSGLDWPEGVQDPVAEAFCSSSPEVGGFACSDPMVNRLWQNIRWTARANLMGVPTDCPQRDERLGWTGDLVAFGQTLACMLDTDGFYAKWLQDLRDSQALDGRYPDFAPHPYGKDDRFTGAPGWGDAGVVCAYFHWLNSGDADTVRKHMGSMRRYMVWLALANPDHVWRNARHNDYGDWLNGDTLRREGWDSTGSEMPKEAFATAMWAQSARLLATMAGALGDEEAAGRYARMADDVAGAFAREFVAPDGEVRGDTQAGYALALRFGLVPEPLRGAALAKLAAAIGRRGGHLSTGFHSTHHMLEVLTASGRHDLAASILLKKTFPSWGYTIENGATTLWERWDGYVAGRGFQDPGMNSFNHWALGSVGQWLFERVGGLAPLSPGWRRVRYAPTPTPGLEWGEATRLLPGGLAEARWERAGAGVVFRLAVPANTEGLAVLPEGARFDGGQPPRAEGGWKLAPGAYVARLAPPRP